MLRLPWAQATCQPLSGAFWEGRGTLPVPPAPTNLWFSGVPTAPTHALMPAAAPAPPLIAARAYTPVATHVAHNSAHPACRTGRPGLRLATASLTVHTRPLPARPTKPFVFSPSPPHSLHAPSPCPSHTSPMPSWTLPRLSPPTPLPRNSTLAPLLTQTKIRTQTCRRPTQATPMHRPPTHLLHALPTLGTTRGKRPALFSAHGNCRGRHPSLRLCGSHDDSTSRPAPRYTPSSPPPLPSPAGTPGPQPPNARTFFSTTPHNCSCGYLPLPPPAHRISATRTAPLPHSSK